MPRGSRRSAAERLRERGEREERQLRETLEGQRRRVEAELTKHDTSVLQLELAFSEDERRQREADVASWRTRLAQFYRDLADRTHPHPRVLRGTGQAGGTHRAGISLAGYRPKGD